MGSGNGNRFRSDEMTLREDSQLLSRDSMKTKPALVLLTHAFVGWALCAATMFVGMSTTTIQNTLIIHAIAAPIFFAIVSYIYANKFNYTSPIATALTFVGFVITIDFFVVALLINRSLEMFTSMLGTWIPFALIFTSSYLMMSFRARTPTGGARPRGKQ